MPNIARSHTRLVDYGPVIESELEKLKVVIASHPTLVQRYPPRWLAIQLLERDDDLLAEVQSVGADDVFAALDDAFERLTPHFGADVDVALADARYRFVNHLVHQVVTTPARTTESWSDRVDRVVTNQWLGIPIFLAIMWFVFKITTDVATPFLNWISDSLTGPITNRTIALLQMLHLQNTWVSSLLVDGVIAGVGGVLVFVPVLMSLYLALALLEDSGYMARAAFVMDRFMRIIGLHGKSFLPMIVGFGCNVPAVYATRTLENRRDRILTGLLVPFMSCGARLPVYVLFTAIFFPKIAGPVIFGLYLLGILAAIGVGLVLRKTIFAQTEQTTLVMELPPYRAPNLPTVWQYIWERTSAFINNAWTMILAASLMVWLLMAIPMGGHGTFGNTPVNESAFATLSGGLASTIFKPLGFGNWENSGALVTGFIAKEVVVSTLSQEYSIDDTETGTIESTWQEDLRTVVVGFGRATVDTIKAIPLVVGINLFPGDESGGEPSALMQTIRREFEATSGGHGTLAALAFLVFVLLYTPCVTTLAAQRQEFGAKWMWLGIGIQISLAWALAFLIFQGGKLLGLG